MTKDEGKKPVSLETLNQHLGKVKQLQPEIRSEAKLPGDTARAAIDFASATGVGSAIGYGVDVWQHTSPWGILVGLLIGTAAGIKMMLADMARRDRAETAVKKTND